METSPITIEEASVQSPLVQSLKVQQNCSQWFLIGSDISDVSVFQKKKSWPISDHGKLFKCVYLWE